MELVILALIGMGAMTLLADLLHPAPKEEPEPEPESDPITTFTVTTEEDGIEVINPAKLPSLYAIGPNVFEGSPSDEVITFDPDYAGKKVVLKVSGVDEAEDWLGGEDVINIGWGDATVDSLEEHHILKQTWDHEPDHGSTAILLEEEDLSYGTNTPDTVNLTVTADDLAENAWTVVTDKFGDPEIGDYDTNFLKMDAGDTLNILVAGGVSGQLYKVDVTDIEIDNHVEPPFQIEFHSVKYFYVPEGTTMTQEMFQDIYDLSFGIYSGNTDWINDLGLVMVGSIYLGYESHDYGDLAIDYTGIGLHKDTVQDAPQVNSNMTIVEGFSVETRFRY